MNAGFNASTDIFNMGPDWKVKSCNFNKSSSAAECPNSQGDITHRDVYGEKIAPTAEYTLASDVKSLPALGTVVTIETKKVAISQIVIKTGKGSAPTASVSGVQVNDSATTLRTYSCGTIALSARHKAQDILGLLVQTCPSTLTDATVTFSADVTVADPHGNIVNHDVSNGKVVASFTHTSGDGAAIAAPDVTGSDAVVSQPVTKTSPENDYMTIEYGVTKSLTGADASNV